MPITEVTQYQTSDGKVFPTEAEAELHEAKNAVETILDNRGIGRGGEWTLEMIADAIMDRALPLSEALAAYAEASIALANASPLDDEGNPLAEDDL